MVKERESNIELYRIVLMLLIIAHHYVVNSGLLNVIYTNQVNSNSIFWIIFGAWGKVGINCFVLITGYYMCKSNITLKKFLKLFLEVLFYNLVITIIFMIFSNKFSFWNGIYSILPIKGIGVDFSGCFLFFYLLIPYINLLIKSMNQKQHLFLIIILLIFFTIVPTFPKFSITINYVEWFFVIYLIGSYIRLYPNKIINNRNIIRFGTLVAYIISIVSIVFLLFYSVKHGKRIAYFLVNDCYKIMAVITSIFTFLLFKNMRVKNNKIINTIASSIFGVLLIHANSDAMRSFLWKDVLNNVSLQNQNIYYIIVHGVISVIIIFVVCVLIDQIRIKFIEKPFFNKFDKRIDKLELKIKKILNM